MRVELGHLSQIYAKKFSVNKLNFRIPKKITLNVVIAIEIPSFDGARSYYIEKILVEINNRNILLVNSPKIRDLKNRNLQS
jgi:hypothetical protein